MSANRKSVFLSDISLGILGPFSSGRLNGIIEKYGYLLRTQERVAIFSPTEMEMIYQVAKEKAIYERESWQELTTPALEKLLLAAKTSANSREIDDLIVRVYKLTPLQEVALIDAIEMHWADERVRLFEAYQQRKKQRFTGS
jgi:hypothetical protein